MLAADYISHYIIVRISMMMAVEALVTLQNLHANVVGDVRLSPEALQRLRQRMPNAFPNAR